MLSAYVSAGLPPGEFWGLSLWEYNAQMRGAHDRLEREQDGRAWLAWHIEALHRQERLMSLAEMTGRTETHGAPQSDEDLQSMFDLLATAWGARTD
ncbi:hypothetical protein P775_14260 [Puniceibacterium antarcticum]|uniref:Phage tail assembly chaperone n=1 Tax=Puniceibacterium antarcticum TaxID=1206336 RepID=A0A2G8RDE6_9RHOB|nr:hypothetical protein [Puniceibacterium antarcticum]PIL19513.1 hypothetical protein P775_14260 [Puniceibacterium antarcticum]